MEKTREPREMTGVHSSSVSNEDHGVRAAERALECSDSQSAASRVSCAPIAAESRVTWGRTGRKRPSRSAPARFAVLTAAVTIGMAALGAVFHESTGSLALHCKLSVGWRSTSLTFRICLLCRGCATDRIASASQRMALLQSQVTALREQDFAKASGTRGKSSVVPGSHAGPALVDQPPVGVSPAVAHGAQPVADAQNSGLARAEAQVATVVPKLHADPKAKGVAVQNKARVPLPAKPPPAVKLNKQTQKQLEDEIRALRQAQEKREMKFMKEAAVATANEIARDKQDEEKKAVINHQEHVNAVAMSKMHVEQEWAERTKPKTKPRSTASNEVENVLQKAIDAQEKHAKAQGSSKVSPRKVAQAKAIVKQMTAPKPLSPAEQKAIKIKQAAEAKLKAAEKKKVEKMAAKVGYCNWDRSVCMVLWSGVWRV